MKEIIICAMLLLISFSSFSQQANPKPVLTQEEALRKSKNAKEEAYILLIGGAIVLTITAGATVGNELCFTCAEKPFPFAPVIIGGGMVVGSIALFNRSNHLKRQAMSLSLKNETSHQIVNSNVVSRPVPSLSLKIGF